MIESKQRIGSARGLGLARNAAKANLVEKVLGVVANSLNLPPGPINANISQVKMVNGEPVSAFDIKQDIRDGYVIMSTKLNKEQKTNLIKDFIDNNK